MTRIINGAWVQFEGFRMAVVANVGRVQNRVRARWTNESGKGKTMSREEVN
jgi:hypothetical protein